MAVELKSNRSCNRRNSGAGEAAAVRRRSLTDPRVDWPPILTGGWCSTSLAVVQRPGHGPHGIVKAQRRRRRDEAGHRGADQHEAGPVDDAVVDAPRPAGEASLAVGRHDVQDQRHGAADC